MIYSEKSGSEWQELDPTLPSGQGGAKAPGLGLGAASSEPEPAKEAPPYTYPPSPTPGLLSAIHPLELACRDHFRKPVGGWKQLVSRAGGRLRAAENECPAEDKAENKGKPVPFPNILFGLIF